MKRNPIRARAALDSAPGSHPREAPRRGLREQAALKEETILLDVRIQRALGPLDYALCRARETGSSWSEIADLLKRHLGGAWSPQRAASRTRRAQANFDRVLAEIRDLETPQDPVRTRPGKVTP